MLLYLGSYCRETNPRGTTTLSIVNGKIVGHRSSSSNDDDEDDEAEDQKRKMVKSAPKVKYELAKGEKFLDVSEEQQTLNLAKLLEPMSPDNSAAREGHDKENLEDSRVKVRKKHYIYNETSN